MNTYEKLVEYLEEGEAVEGIVLGKESGGWGMQGHEGQLMSLEAVRPILEKEKSIRTPFLVWTNARIVFVTDETGYRSAEIRSVPIKPVAIIPEFIDE